MDVNVYGLSMRLASGSDRAGRSLLGLPGHAWGAVNLFYSHPNSRAIADRRAVAALSERARLKDRPALTPRGCAAVTHDLHAKRKKKKKKKIAKTPLTRTSPPRSRSDTPTASRPGRATAGSPVQLPHVARWAVPCSAPRPQGHRKQVMKRDHRSASPVGRARQAGGPDGRPRRRPGPVGYLGTTPARSRRSAGPLSMAMDAIDAMLRELYSNAGTARVPRSATAMTRPPCGPRRCLRAVPSAAARRRG